MFPEKQHQRRCPVKRPSAATAGYTFNPAASTRYYNDPEFTDEESTGGARGTMAGPNFTGVFLTGSSASVQQTLAATLEADTQYTLTVALGHRTVDSGAAATASLVTLELLAGGISLGTATYDPSGGIWDDTGALPDDIWGMRPWSSPQEPIPRSLDRH